MSKISAGLFYRNDVEVVAWEGLHDVTPGLPYQVSGSGEHNMHRIRDDSGLDRFLTEEDVTRLFSRASIESTDAKVLTVSMDMFKAAMSQIRQQGDAISDLLSAVEDLRTDVSAMQYNQDRS